MKLDIQYRKLSIRVVSRVAKQLKSQDLRKKKNIRKMLNLVGGRAQCAVSLPKIEIWQWQSKDMENSIPNCSWPVQFYWISLFCSKYFAQDYPSKDIFRLKLVQSSADFNFLTFSILSKHLSNPEGKYEASQSC